MKVSKIYQNALMILVSGLLMLASCKKDDDGESRAGASSNPQVSAITPAVGAAGEVLTVTGSGLGGIETIWFEKDSVKAGFNPNFNTDKAILFRIPEDAIPGDQKVYLKNTSGKIIELGFKVLGLATITEVSNNNYTPGQSITLKGRNLDDVEKVELAGTTTMATIVSKTATQLVISFPASSAISNKLNIYNTAGRAQTTVEFVNRSNAFIFFDDDYANGYSNGSWGPAEVSSTVAKGDVGSSFKATWMKGNWSANGFANWSGGATYSADYKYFTFWVKGGAVTREFYITIDERAGGYGNADRTFPITVPANVWTYFKIELDKLKPWEKGGAINQIGFWIPGPDDADETLYFDDIMFTK